MFVSQLKLSLSRSLSLHIYHSKMAKSEFPVSFPCIYELLFCSTTFQVWAVPVSLNTPTRRVFKVSLLITALRNRTTKSWLWWITYRQQSLKAVLLDFHLKKSNIWCGNFLQFVTFSIWGCQGAKYPCCCSYIQSQYSLNQEKVYHFLKDMTFTFLNVAPLSNFSSSCTILTSLNLWGLSFISLILLQLYFLFELLLWGQSASVYPYGEER